MTFGMEAAVSSANGLALDSFNPNTFCNACKQILEEGSVVAFGDFIYHVDCFRCIKCNKQANNSSNLLLVGEGLPVCEDCSYNCKACGTRILDLAIMTGNEAYHAECFQCRVCHKPIEDLVFAKTNQGIYCMNCHNERIAKSQRRQREQTTKSANAPNVQKELPSILPSNRHANNEQVSRSEDAQMISKTSSLFAETIADRLSQQDWSSCKSSHSVASQFVDDKLLEGFTQSAPTKTTTDSAKAIDASHTRTKVTTSREAKAFLSKKLSGHKKSRSMGDAIFQLNVCPQDQLRFETSLKGDEREIELPRQKHVDTQLAGTTDRNTDEHPLLNPGDSTISRKTNVEQGLYMSQEKTSSVGQPISASNMDSECGKSCHEEGKFDQLDGTNGSTSSPGMLSQYLPNSPSLQGFPIAISEVGDFIYSLPPSMTSQARSKHGSKLVGPFTMGRSTKEDQGSKDHSPFRSPLSMIKNCEEEFEQPNQIQIDSNTNSALSDPWRMQSQGVDVVPKSGVSFASLSKPSTNVQIDEASKAINRIVAEGKDLLASLYSEDDIAQTEVKHLKQPNINPEILIEKINNSLEDLKLKYQLEINTLHNEKEALLQETLRLTKVQDESMEQIRILNYKNKELTDIHHDLISQIQDCELQMSSKSTFIEMSLSGIDLHRQNSQGCNEISELKGNRFSTADKAENREIVDFNGSRRSNSSISFGVLPNGVMPAAVARSTHSINESVFSEKSRTESVTEPKISKWRKGSSAAFRRVRGIRDMIKSDQPLEEMVTGPMVLNSISTNSGLNFFPDTYKNAPTISKNHKFMSHWYVLPVKCLVCNARINGLEQRCADCNSAVHIQCISRVSFACSDIKSYPDDGSVPSDSVESLFGGSLERQIALGGRSIPKLVVFCIEMIEQHGMRMEGLYRKSGGASAMRKIREAFEAGLEPDFSEGITVDDICAVMSILKQYIRMLPSPLIPFNRYEQFLTATVPYEGSDISKLAPFAKALSQLPQARYDCLAYLMLHLNRVAAHSDYNLMTSRNLAVCFSPTIMRDHDSKKEMEDIRAKNTCVQFLIDHAQELFVEDIPSPASLTYKVRSDC